MSFDEEDNIESSDDKDKPKTFFGFELGDGVVYGIVIVLAVIFIYQVAGVIAVL